MPGRAYAWTFEEITALPAVTITTDLHCAATHHDGEPLTAEHGFPLRLVVPHLYGYKGPKWLRGIEYMTQDRRGFWEERGYRNIADPWAGQRHSYQEDTP
ncbi:molybdopterin-dependent oxidoreductase [Streptomyces sp. NPDC058290]|uniref:molybdopterin-dependent oxidoreductase n=1 Tax=Streptomyces sp. NPDC058290 TaxID=3346426 RepID=UPI0036E0F68C